MRTRERKERLEDMFVVDCDVHVHESPQAIMPYCEMREELDEIHVDIGVLFPDHFLKIPVISQVDYASALARAYNAWLLEEWCSPENGLLGCILACPQDPEDAAREIEKYST